MTLTTIYWISTWPVKILAITLLPKYNDATLMIAIIKVSTETSLKLSLANLILFAPIALPTSALAVRPMPFGIMYRSPHIYMIMIEAA